MSKLYKQIQIANETLTLKKNTPSSEPVETREISWQMLHLFINVLDVQTTETVSTEKYEQGFRNGIQQTMDQFSEQKKNLGNLVNAIPQAIEKNRLDLKQEIADIVLTLIQQLFLQQGPDRHSLEIQINNILTELNQQQTVKIHLHPDDISLLQQGRIQLHTNPLQNLEIVAQPTLLPGGCLIHTEHGIFDASLEKRFQRFQEILLQIKQENQHANLA